MEVTEIHVKQHHFDGREGETALCCGAVESDGVACRLFGLRGLGGLWPVAAPPLRRVVALLASLEAVNARQLAITSDLSSPTEITCARQVLRFEMVSSA